MIDPCSPVEEINTHSIHKDPEEGIALCLSGGGYRAMLFHLGALWRLNELGILKKLSRISSVSGGSIVACVLGKNWGKLGFGSGSIAQEFVPQVVEPVRRLADKTIDTKAIFLGLITPGTINDKLARIYRKLLFGKATLRDLPDDPPRFVINASNVQSGALWRFMKPYMADWKVGKIEKPDIPLAVAVAASSAFPPVLSPIVLKLRDSDFTPNSGDGLQKAPFTSRAILTDGGVYDNLGLETAWKRYKNILVSDGGGQIEPEPQPKKNWISHLFRIFQIVDNQVRSLRKQQVIESFRNGSRQGTYWGIRTNIVDYNLSDVINCPHNRTMKLARIRTRLKKLDNIVQERLINWGYAVCDAAIRKHVDRGHEPPKSFPYPESNI
jgi:NTE family protein